MYAYDFWEKWNTFMLQLCYIMQTMCMHPKSPEKYPVHLDKDSYLL